LHVGPPRSLRAGKGGKEPAAGPSSRLGRLPPLVATLETTCNFFICSVFHIKTRSRHLLREGDVNRRFFIILRLAFKKKVIRDVKYIYSRGTLPWNARRLRHPNGVLEVVIIPTTKPLTCRVKTSIHLINHSVPSNYRQV